jgi:capsular polysaccharide transport system permease protein
MTPTLAQAAASADSRVQRAERKVAENAAWLMRRAQAERRQAARRQRRRRLALVFSFLLGVMVPTAAAEWYLNNVALDQYASHVGFSVRKEEPGSAVELLGGITELSGSTSSDTDILNKFIQSQQMVRRIDARLDLGRVYARPEDPVFALGDDHRIEALTGYWQRMVRVYYDSSSELIEVRVLAFDPQDAQRIARAVFDESSALVNRLSDIAREDTTRHARDELDRALARLKQARQAKTAFRNRTRIADPSADIKGQMGVLNSLQAQLADAIITRELLMETSTGTDPRLAQQRRKIEVIRKQIDGERARFGSGKAGAQGDAEYARLLAEFEALEVDQEFAEASYVRAQTAYDMALADAQRKSRYLASHIEPTLAETAEYPRRGVLLMLIGGGLFLAWSILVMMAYALRDRR